MLLVEDVAENREMLVRFLSKSGKFTVKTASNGLEAIKGNSFDIVLMDLGMPIMDGREAIGIIRGWNDSRFKTIPIVALTADNFDIGTETNFTDVIKKPFSPRELHSKVIDILAQT